jgi:hypothetical protein
MALSDITRKNMDDLVTEVAELKFWIEVGAKAKAEASAATVRTLMAAIEADLEEK